MGTSTLRNQNMWLVQFIPWKLILRMCSRYKHVNRQFQAKNSQHKNSNISKTIKPIESKFEYQAETFICSLSLCGQSARKFITAFRPQINIIFCDFCCFTSATLLPSSLWGVVNCYVYFLIYIQAFYKVFLKKMAQSLQHHIFATISHRVMQFSTKRPEIKCLHN